jgi:hypothetical protein
LGRAGWINKFRLVLIEHNPELYLSHHGQLLHLQRVLALRWSS